MSAQSSRSSLKSKHKLKEDIGIQKRRISFSEKKFVRTFSNESEVGEWNNSYEETDLSQDMILKNSNSKAKTNLENLKPNNTLLLYSNIEDNSLHLNVDKTQSNEVLKIENSTDITLMDQEKSTLNYEDSPTKIKTLKENSIFKFPMLNQELEKKTENKTMDMEVSVFKQPKLVVAKNDGEEFMEISAEEETLMPENSILSSRHAFFAKDRNDPSTFKKINAEKKRSERRGTVLFETDMSLDSVGFVGSLRQTHKDVESTDIMDISLSEITMNGNTSKINLPVDASTNVLENSLKNQCHNKSPHLKQHQKDDVDIRDISMDTSFNENSIKVFNNARNQHTLFDLPELDQTSIPNLDLQVYKNFDENLNNSPKSPKTTNISNVDSHKDLERHIQEEVTNKWEIPNNTVNNKITKTSLSDTTKNPDTSKIDLLVDTSSGVLDNTSFTNQKNEEDVKNRTSPTGYNLHECSNKFINNIPKQDNELKQTPTAEEYSKNGHRNSDANMKDLSKLSASVCIDEDTRIESKNVNIVYNSPIYSKEMKMEIISTDLHQILVPIPMETNSNNINCTNLENLYPLNPTDTKCSSNTFSNYILLEKNHLAHPMEMKITSNKISNCTKLKEHHVLRQLGTKSNEEQIIETEETKMKKIAFSKVDVLDSKILNEITSIQTNLHSTLRKISIEHKRQHYVNQKQLSITEILLQDFYVHNKEKDCFDYVKHNCSHCYKYCDEKNTLRLEPIAVKRLKFRNINELSAFPEIIEKIFQSRSSNLKGDVSKFRNETNMSSKRLDDKNWIWCFGINDVNFTYKGINNYAVRLYLKKGNLKVQTIKRHRDGDKALAMDFIMDSLWDNYINDDETSKSIDDIALIFEKITKLCENSINTVKTLSKIISCYGAQLLRTSQRILIKKIHRRLEKSLESNDEKVIDCMFQIDVTNMNTINFKNILHPPLNNFKKELAALPSGPEFLKIILSKPFEYIK